MRRSPALAPLSQDHHHALVIASALTRAGTGTCASSALLYADFIREHESRHFALEEALLLPALPAGERSQRLSARVRADHRYLCELAQQLSSGGIRPTLELTAALGTRLRAHVQLEERELFPCIEGSLDPVSLERLGTRLARAIAVGV